MGSNSISEDLHKSRLHLHKILKKTFTKSDWEQVNSMLDINSLLLKKILLYLLPFCLFYTLLLLEVNALHILITLFMLDKGHLIYLRAE